MRTSEVFQLCLVIIGVVSLVLQANQKEEVTATPPSTRLLLKQLGGQTVYR